VGEQRGRVVDTCLRAHEEAIESRDVTAGRARTESVRLDERRPGSGEGIPDELAGRGVAKEEDLGELRDELAQVRMHPVDVLRSLALGELCLRPGELEVDLLVEGRLCAHRRELRRASRLPCSPLSCRAMSAPVDVL